MSLVAGILSIAFAIFVFVMWLLHPKGEGGLLFLYLPLLFMMGSGVIFCVVFFNKKVTVEEMNICYVNSFKKKKEFTLDEIGFCKMETNSGKITLILYNLTGDRLCKLDFGMQGMGEFLQYLVDNRVRTELGRERRHKREMLLPELILKETAVCAEEIGKCAEAFYRVAEQVFRDWEKRNRKFEVEWELGFAEYTAADLERQAGCNRPWEWTSSLGEEPEEIPQDYVCILEAYLKRDGAYVVNHRGEAVSMQVPYMSRCRSYQIGERTRIRKSDEEMMAEEIMNYLAVLSREMPRHKYRTEQFSVCHKLRKTAGRLPVRK